jgi:hypothetical protein
MYYSSVTIFMVPSTTECYVMNSADNLIKEITFMQRGHLTKFNAYYVCNGLYFRWQKIICKKTATATAFKSITTNNASDGMEIEGLWKYVKTQSGLLALANIQPWVSKIQMLCQ